MCDEHFYGHYNSPYIPHYKQTSYKCFIECLGLDEQAFRAGKVRDALLVAHVVNVHDVLTHG